MVFWQNGRAWHENGQLWQHAFWKNKDLVGEYKAWDEQGELYTHSYYEEGSFKSVLKSVLPKEIKSGFIYADGKYWQD